MIRNPRERYIARIRSELDHKIWETVERYDLTYLELMEILTVSMARAVRLGLRDERTDGISDSGTEKTNTESGSLDNTTQD